MEVLPASQYLEYQKTNSKSTPIAWSFQNSVLCFQSGITTHRAKSRSRPAARRSRSCRSGSKKRFGRRRGRTCRAARSCCRAGSCRRSPKTCSRSRRRSCTASRAALCTCCTRARRTAGGWAISRSTRRRRRRSKSTSPSSRPTRAGPSCRSFSSE